jgi:outer membrane protein TolC
LAATAPFLPSAELSVMDEKYAPANGGGPVIVVGNNVLGGPQVRSGYGTLSLSWNIMNSGRDVAGLRGAKAAERAAASAVDSQLADTLSGVLQAYADLYEAEVAAESDGNAVSVLRDIYARAQERYQSGNGTTVAIGQARNSELGAEQTFNASCRAVTEKSAALAAAIGLRISGQQYLTAAQPEPVPLLEGFEPREIDPIVESTPAVAAAREKVAAATAKLQQA